MENETQLFNKRLLNRNKINAHLLGKIPKCTKNISIPKNINNKNTNKKTLLPSKQSSTSSLKNTNYNSKKSSSRRSIPFIQTRNVHSSLQNFNQILQKKSQKNNVYSRIISSDKSKSEKIDESSTSRKNLNIDHLYNYKIEYYLLKDNIQKILNNQIDKDNIDITNKIMGEIIIKLKNIMEKINAHVKKKENKGGKKELTVKEGYNKKLLILCEEKYNKEYEKLKELSNNNYITRINTELKEIQNKINCIEKENKELILDNQFNNTNKIFNTITLPNIKKANNNNNKIIKNEEKINIEKQLQNKIKEYKNQIGQELLISKKIKDNELNLKKYEEIINDLNSKYNTLQTNLEKGIFPEEDIINEYDNKKINNNLPKINNINNINNQINSIDENILNEKDNNKKKPKNELVLIEKKRISKINKNNGLNPLLDKNLEDDNTSKNKDIQNKNTIKNITLENLSKIEENHNLLSLPYRTSKKKNLSCANVTSNINISNNKTIKELILKNLDQKEKEEKTLINIHENDTISSNKYKHIKLKPNFSFNNDYYLFKDEKIKKIPKLQSSVENKSKMIVNLYNNKEKEELINESINIDESSTKNNDTNKNNDNLIKLNCNFNNNTINSNLVTNNKDENTSNNSISETNNKRITKKRKNPNGINNKNNMILMPSTKNNQINEEEKKNDRLSTYGEQREKVLNTIMYDDIVEQGSIL